MSPNLVVGQLHRSRLRSVDNISSWTTVLEILIYKIRNRAQRSTHPKMSPGYVTSSRRGLLGSVTVSHHTFLGLLGEDPAPRFLSLHVEDEEPDSQGT